MNLNNELNNDMCIINDKIDFRNKNTHLVVSKKDLLSQSLITFL